MSAILRVSIINSLLNTDTIIIKNIVENVLRLYNDS